MEVWEEGDVVERDYTPAWRNTAGKGLACQ